MTGLEHIAFERLHQILDNRYTVHKDVERYNDAATVDGGSELVRGALQMIMYPTLNSGPDWAMARARKTKDMDLSPVAKRIDRLRVAGALLAAEIDRLQVTEHAAQAKQQNVSPIQS